MTGKPERNTRWPGWSNIRPALVRRFGRIRLLSALLVSFLALVACYYAWHWRSVAGFVRAIDHSDRLFTDFVNHFHPMGQYLLSLLTPCPGYFYSAFFALLLLPFGQLPVDSALWPWGTIQLFSLLFAAVLPFRYFLNASVKMPFLYLGLIATSLPFLHNFAWGNVSLLLFVCVLGAFHVYGNGKHVLAGILLALATAIKFYPALFLAPFVLKREKRVLISFVLATLLFYVILPAAALGPADWASFEHDGRIAIATGNWITRDVNSQYVVHVMLRWAALLHLSVAQAPWTQMIRLFGLAVAGLNVAALWRLQRRKHGAENILSLTALCLSLPFLLKTSWPHYFVYLPFCQVVLLLQINQLFPRSGIPWRGFTAMIWLSIALGSVFMFNSFPHWKVYSQYGLLFAANGLLLLPLYAIAVIETPPLVIPAPETIPG